METSSGYFDYYSYLYAMDSRMRQLEQRVLALEDKVAELAGELASKTAELAGELAGVRAVRIENVHYKVQELNVRDLSGTLQLGLTALTDPEQLDRWLKEQGSGEPEVSVGSEAGQTDGSEGQ